MSNHSQQIVQKLWNYCNVLRDDGLSYGDYVEQLTLLLFLKMAHERTQAPWKQASAIPAGFDWPSLTSKDGDALETHYRHILEELGKRDGMLGIIFRVKHNPSLDKDQKKHLKLHALRGVEIVDGVTRLAAMNLILHGVGPTGKEADPPVTTDDSLRSDPGDRFDLVLTNPPFGKKSSVMVVNAQGEQAREALEVVRDDFWASTSNKQLNLKRSDLDEFVTCYHPENRRERTPTWTESIAQGCWRSYPYAELLQRDKVSLDIFWLKDESLEDSANLEDPDVIAAEIIEDLRAALEEFELIQGDLAPES